MTPLARRRSMAANGAADAGSGQMPSFAPRVTTQRASSSLSIVTDAPSLRRRTSTACTVPWMAPHEVAMEGALRGRSGGNGTTLATHTDSETERYDLARQAVRD